MSQTLLDFYSGYEGGEYWTEGSGTDEVMFKLSDPGKYRLLLFGQTGTRETPEVNPVGRHVTIKISQGAGIARWHLVLAVIFLVWFILEMVLKGSFEKRRWGDDDDGDGEGWGWLGIAALVACDMD